MRLKATMSEHAHRAITATVENVILALAYVASAGIGLSLAVGNDSVTAVWPPTAVAVSALVLRGRRVWPGIAAGALIANWANGLAIPLAAGIAVGNTLGPLAAARLLRRLDARPTLQRVRDVLALCVGGAALPMLISATSGTAVLFAGGQVEQSMLASVWTLWWIGDALGVIVFAPLLLTFATIRRADSPFLQQPLRAVASIAAALVVAGLVLKTDPQLRFIVLLFALWVAMRFEQHGAALCTVILSVLVIGHATSRPPFSDGELIFAQAIDATLAVTLLTFAAAISERRRASDALATSASELEERVRARTGDLAASEDRLAQAQRLAQIGSFEWDAKADANIWSDELYRIYGLPSSGEPPGMDEYLSFIDPTAREDVRVAVTNAVATGEPLSHEYPIALPDGTRKWVNAYVEVVHDRDGGLAGLRGTCQDVTERKHAENAMRASEEKLRVLLSSAPDSMVVTDEDGRIVLVNDEVTNLLGYEPEELVGQTVETLLPESLRASHLKHREGYLKSPQRRPMGAGLELFARTKAGGMIPVDVSLSPVTTEEGVVVFASLRDATERRRAETALRTALARELEATDHLRKLDAAKSAFLSAVSHELRTPLTSILGFTELLQEPGLDDATKNELVDRVDANAQRLQRLLGDLLDIDRLQRGILEPHRQRVELRTLVERALGSFHLRSHPLTVTVDHQAVWIDPGQTERVVENLMSNAVKYTPRGTPIHLSAKANGDGGATITVTDEGPGIPDDRKTSIFEEFVRLGDDAFTQGTGVGLALVDRFAKLHGGKAWVEDRPGGGACFHVELAGPAGADADSDVA